MAFTLQQYWDRRAASYEIHDVLGRSILKHYLEVLKPRSLVEVGCGRGELFPLYTGIPRVAALDFSAKMLEYSQRRIDRHGLPIELHKMDITGGCLAERFDVAATRTVLMHIHPDQIKAAAENTGKMSDRLYLFEYWEENAGRLSPHNWLHDYVGLFTVLGYRLADSYSRSDVPQVLFMFER